MRSSVTKHHTLPHQTQYFSSSFFTIPLHHRSLLSSLPSPSHTASIPSSFPLSIYLSLSLASSFSRLCVCLPLSPPLITISFLPFLPTKIDQLVYLHNSTLYKKNNFIYFFLHVYVCMYVCMYVRYSFSHFLVPH